MGTQQILLIVLSVIIVGVAIAVGITMFSNQAYNSNQQAVSGELQNYGSQCIQFFKTPTSQGGAGQDAGATVLTIAAVATFIGFTGTTPANSLTTDNGTFAVTGVDNTAADPTVTLMGLGKELKNSANPLVTTTVHLLAGTITSSVSTGTALPVAP